MADRIAWAVEPAVDAFDAVLVLHQTAVTGQHGHVLGQRIIVGDDGPGVVHRAQILARIEGIGRSLAEGADLLPIVARQMRRRAVLDDPELVCLRAIAMIASISAGCP